MLIGLPGAGKSTLADALCVRAGLTRIDRDAIRAARFPGRRVTAGQKKIASALVFRAAAVGLRDGRSVLIDGMTFARSAERRRARGLARREGARCVELHLACAPALARRRVAKHRGHPSGDRSPALVAAVARRFEPASRSAVRLDAREPVERLARQALAALKA